MTTVLLLNYRAGVFVHERRLDGIRRFARSQGWTVVPLPPGQSGARELKRALAKYSPAGCFVEASFRDPSPPQSAFGQLPTVKLDPPSSSRFGADGAVVCGNAAVARSAFDELAATMPPAFAVVTYRMRRSWAHERVAAFRAICREANRPCATFPAKFDETPEARAARLADWARSLPPHCAVFAVNDYTAWETWNALRTCGRHVPKTATVIGVDGGKLDPDGSESHLSTVRLDYERTGFLGGRLLASIIVGGRRGKRQIEVFGPLMVQRRESTRGYGRRDTRILDAVGTIRREACDGLTAAALAARFDCSRNLFERRFREAMGHSVLDEILYVRLEQACELLRGSGATIAQIAAKCGFGTERDFRKIFRARLRTSPREWRVANAY